MSSGLIFDLVIAAIIVLYFLWGFFKGYDKPLTGIISWGVFILAFYLLGKTLSNVFLINCHLEEVFRDVVGMLESSLGIQVSGVQIDNIIKVFGLLLSGFCMLFVIKLITFIINIVIRKARRAHKKNIVDRIVGAFLNLIKGAIVIFVVMSAIHILAHPDVIGIQDINNIIDSSTFVKYICQYNPITMLVKVLR